MSTTYTGIDYGLGNVNIDKSTGIRYGVISQHSVNQDALNDIFQNGRDLQHEGFVAQVKSNLRSAFSDYFSERTWGSEKQSKLDAAVENAFDAISDDLSDGHSGDSSDYLYEHDGYSIQTCMDSDLMITKSPFFTYAQFCSPCVPGACNLDSPLEIPLNATDQPLRDNQANLNKCFALGHDWFDDGKAPYSVYSVITGELIQPTKP